MDRNPNVPDRGRRRFPRGPLVREIEELDEPAVMPEEVLRVTSATVVLYDEALLVHDFPELAEARLVARSPALARADPAERRELVRRFHHDWLIRHAALISRPQAASSAVSTPIATGEAVTAYRPPRYGRALVTSLSRTAGPEDETPARGLLDLKGAGVQPGRTPHLGAYGSGLCSLYRALSDTFYQWLLDEIFARAAPWCWTMPVYGVLDLGFDVRSSPPAPAGLQIRRAHRRPRAAVELPRSGSAEEVVKLEIELLLRHYGLSSCTSGTSISVRREGGRVRALHGGGALRLSPGDEYRILKVLIARREVRFDGVNVQLAREVSLSPRAAQLVDFGQYSVRDRFEQPIASLVRDRPALLGHPIWPDSPHFVQPDPRVALSASAHSSSATKRWVSDLALRFRAGAVSGDGVRAEIDQRVDAATRAWGPLP